MIALRYFRLSASYPMDNEEGRAVVLDDARLLRPEMVKARKGLEDAQSKHDIDCMHHSEEQDEIARLLNFDTTAEAWWELSDEEKHAKIIAKLTTLRGLRGKPLPLP